MMIPITESFWPYVLIAAFWSVVFGWFVKRAWKGRSRFRMAEDGVNRSPDPRAPTRVEDTQAGRI